NICTAQVLLAIMSGMYAVYHGPKGLTAIARRTHALARMFAKGLEGFGHPLRHTSIFDTVTVELSPERAQAIFDAAGAAGMNLRRIGRGALGVALDGTTRPEDVRTLLSFFAEGREVPALESLAVGDPDFPEGLARTSEFLSHPVFNSHHSETQMLRYMRRLESRDLSLAHSMIPLGSCTMKLNATSEMIPITWPSLSRLHPFVPADQAEGYREIFRQLEGMLCEITGFSACSPQPNAGSQGEFAGLLAIRAYHHARGEAHRNVCLIPASAHGTNPASAALAGLNAVVVRCDAQGNVDVADLEEKAKAHADNLAALMVTYPSTHGVFEVAIKDICRIVHTHGGQVYLDGANLNAMVGLVRVAELGADVCH